MLLGDRSVVAETRSKSARTHFDTVDGYGYHSMDDGISLSCNVVSGDDNPLRRHIQHVSLAKWYVQ